jgi:predicted metallopeptidase
MVYEEKPELKDIIKKLMRTFPEKLNYVNPDRILYSSFSRRSSKAAARIGPIPERVSIFLNDYDYILEVHKQTWDTASEAINYYTILHELFHIPSGGFDSESDDHRRIIRHDLQDFKELIGEYGVNLENLVKLERKIGI